MADNGIKIDPEFRDLLPKLTDDELKRLRAKLIREPARRRITVWQEKLTCIDGHNTKAICDGEGFGYEIDYLNFADRKQVCAWIIDNQLARRNLTDDRRAYYIGHDHLKDKNQSTYDTVSQVFKKETDEHSAKQVAEKHGVNPRTVVRNAEFAEAVDVIGTASPERKEEILSGQSGKTRPQIVEESKVFCRDCRVNGPKKGCVKCKALRKLKAAPKEEEVAEEPEEAADATAADRMKASNSAIESWCRQAVALLETLPHSPWLDDDMNRRESVASKIRSACEAARSAKGHCECPKCEGGGCKACHKTGWVTKYVRQQMD